MWLRIWRYTGSFILAAAGLSGVAQPKDSAEVVNFRPTGVRLGLDLIPLVRGMVDPEFSGWEAAADVDFHRYFLVGEFGSLALQQTTSDGDHESKGTYYRFGADVNFIRNDPDRNAFFFGMRYARSSFREKLTYAYEDPVWGDGMRTVTIDNGTAGWAEMVMGLKVKIWKEVWLGFTSRYKFALSADGSDQMNPYLVPGYGLAGRRSYWGFNYYIFYRIPLRK
jgi:hypothetical protein